MNQKHIFERAHKVLPAGGFGNFDPRYIIRKGKGSRIWDEDNNEYIDYLIGSGPMILGHCNSEVIEVVKEQLGKGTSFFANNAIGVELAEEICNAVACAQHVRYFSSGSEADMYAFRLARAFTGRDKIMKFEGGYHGMSGEAQMSLAPEKLVNFPIAIPDSAGIQEGIRESMLVAPFNDIEFARSLIHEHKNDIAAIIVEPLQRVIPPLNNFLKDLREECTKRDILLIFDEVVTGFRFSYGGAQELYGVTPDICTLGKIIGGGFPLAAVAGKSDIMAHFDKNKVEEDKFLMHIGTLSGNPIAAAAGLKTLEILRRPSQYSKLETNGRKLMDAFTKHLSKTSHDYQIVGHPSMFDVVFSNSPIRNYRELAECDKVKAARFNRNLLDQGVFKSPGKLYISLALTDDDIEQTGTAISNAVDRLPI